MPNFWSLSFFNCGKQKRQSRRYAEITLENIFNCKTCMPETWKAIKEICKNYTDTAVFEARHIQDTFFEKAETSIYRYDLGSGYNKFQVSVVFLMKTKMAIKEIFRNYPETAVLEGSGLQDPFCRKKQKKYL